MDQREMISSILPSTILAVRWAILASFSLWVTRTKVVPCRRLS